MKLDYLKFVQWSEEDRIYVGYYPDLFLGRVCQGRDENKVYSGLCRLVAEDLKQRRRSKESLPSSVKHRRHAYRHLS
jgi:hypothetical protein